MEERFKKAGERDEWVIKMYKTSKKKAIINSDGGREKFSRKVLIASSTAHLRIVFSYNIMNIDLIKL